MHGQMRCARRPYPVCLRWQLDIVVVIWQLAAFQSHLPRHGSSTKYGSINQSVLTQQHMFLVDIRGCAPRRGGVFFGHYLSSFPARLTSHPVTNHTFNNGGKSPSTRRPLLNSEGNTIMGAVVVVVVAFPSLSARKNYTKYHAVQDKTTKNKMGSERVHHPTTTPVSYTHLTLPTICSV